jgi:2,4-dienoyl-CoA reductase-like NADH-dependent reductase (Old Yellow Enzyme family)
MTTSFSHLGGFRDVKRFQAYLAANGIDLPCDETLLHGPTSPLGEELHRDEVRLGNRFAIHPMEGWDGTTEGRPTELTFRRWRRFGASGAKLIWGGEAVAVCHAGRANPNQLCINNHSLADLRNLREVLLEEHERATGSTAHLLVGLQLTHSGRYSQPNAYKRPEPRILYHHPFLDRRLGLNTDYPLITDCEIREIIEQFQQAAAIAAESGFDFVDIKHCHGYLGHEFLSAHTRHGDYGGSFLNRTRFLRETVAAVRAASPKLIIGVRVSAFDTIPFDATTSHEIDLPYRWGFGVNTSKPSEIDLTETVQFLSLLSTLGIKLVNITAGSPYYNPHLQRPALYPPSDGYAPPEDPLAGVARQMLVTRSLKTQFPELIIVGSAYSYLQDFLPHVAQAAVREGWTDCVGLGRMVLSYPTLPLDVICGRDLQRKNICRTFSDCTSAPRNGLPSGCYPLDAFYKSSESAARLKQIKLGKRSANEN